MQKDPEPAYNFRLVERVVEYLHTRDATLFPFAIQFDDEREDAFVRDLREGLSDLVDSGSARKTSATGFILSDRRLREIVRVWAQAGGEWPAASDPSALYSPLAAN